MTTTPPPPPPADRRVTDLGEALRFGMSYLGVEARQVLSNRWRRRTTAVWLALVAEGAAIGAGIGWFGHHLITGLAVGVAVGLATGPVTAVIAEALGYRRAIWRQFHSSNGQRFGAYALDRGSHWEVLAVHAHPTGAGHGNALMSDLLCHADDRGTTLTLRASGPDAVRFYRRIGFQVVGPAKLAATPMLRQPAGVHAAVEMSDPPLNLGVETT